MATFSTSHTCHMWRILDFSTSFMWRHLKFLHVWRNFQFSHNCHKWKDEIFPQDIFFSTNNISDISDKYQVWFDYIISIDLSHAVLRSSRVENCRTCPRLWRTTASTAQPIQEKWFNALYLVFWKPILTLMLTNENLRGRFRWSLCCCMFDIDVIVLVLFFSVGLLLMIPITISVAAFRWVLVAGSLRQQYHKPSTVLDGDRCSSGDSLYMVLLFYAIQN